MIEGLLVDPITEYREEYEIGASGRRSNIQYIEEANYPGRVETITKELVERLWGLKEDIRYRMYSIVKPTMGNYIKWEGQYCRIVEAIPIRRREEINHYESFLVVT